MYNPFYSLVFLLMGSFLLVSSLFITGCGTGQPPQKIIHHPAKIFHQDGTIAFEATLKNGRLFKNGKPLSGKRVIKYSSGKLWQETEFKDGLANGQHRVWSESGAVIMEREFIDGLWVLSIDKTEKKDGIYYRRISESPGTNEKMQKGRLVPFNGIIREFYPTSGKLRQTITVEFGKPVKGSLFTYYTNGNMKSEEPVGPNGVRRGWHEDGKLDYQINIKGGNPNNGFID